MHLLDICMSSLEKCPFSKLFVYSELLPIFKLNFFCLFFATELYKFFISYIIYDNAPIQTFHFVDDFLYLAAAL